MGDPGLPLTTGEGAALVEELREALDDPKRGEWGGYPWEHLGDAERDVRVLLSELAESEAANESYAVEAKMAREQLDAARQALEALVITGDDLPVIVASEHQRARVKVFSEALALARAALGVEGPAE